MCLRFGSSKPILEGFTNSDISVDVDTSPSTSGYVMIYARRAVLWQLWLQKVVVLSKTEVECMDVVEVGKEIFWMKDFISELGI